MAAPIRHVGHSIRRNGLIVLNNFEQLRGHRSFGWTSALRQQAVETKQDAIESIVIPRKKTWSKEAVLEALASTVGRDTTAYPYQFQDDPYLSPRTPNEFKLYYLSKESGRSAAKYFINNNPKFFTKDFAGPHIPCLMPETVSLLLEEVSEEALKERISLRKVQAAIDMYDQLLQAGTAVSMETTHDLLDLICLCGDRDPEQDGITHHITSLCVEQESGEKRGRRTKLRRDLEIQKTPWRENNNAERIFNLLPERDTRCYSALIRADVHIFNALLTAAPRVRETHSERWELITELLTEMNQQKIQPTLMTFNSVLKALRRCGSMAKTKAPQILSEMKAVGVAPSLATYDHILAIFYKSGMIILTVYLGGVLLCYYLTCFSPQCLDNKDLELGYKINILVEVGENWRLLGDPYQKSIYYGRFFNLLCLMEHIDVVMKWYRQLIPSVYYPNPQGVKDLLQALDTDSRLDLLPTIWKDICSMGHDNKLDLVEEVLSLMAREKQSPEVQESFAVCALEIKKVFDPDRSRPGLEWSTSSLSNITFLLLRVNKMQQAWEMLQLFKSNNRVPSEALLQNFLSACQSNGSPQTAVGLVQLSAAFCLPETPKLAKRALAEFDLTEEQR
uniref:Small ribosomal subunit protein mS39 n=1 Tax=Echeneis naucrates TaxID=173247 RepID=A0A665T832_ECHNA